MTSVLFVNELLQGLLNIIRNKIIVGLIHDQPYYKSRKKKVVTRSESRYNFFFRVALQQLFQLTRISFGIKNVCRIHEFDYIFFSHQTANA